MSRVFYVRYRLINGQLSAIDSRLHLPFSRVCVESYPSRLWYFILEVKSKVEKLLHDTKQFQCCKKMTMMACTQECWNYLHFCMANSDAVFSNFRRNHTEKNVHCDLSLSSSCTIKVLQLIRIYSELSLNCARNLFGVTFGIGIRNRAPRKGEDLVTMHHGDVENVRVHYSRVLAQHPLVTTTLRLSNVDLPERQRTQQEVTFLVTCGTFFLHEGSLVEVVSINGNNVIVRDDETGNEYIIDLCEAARLIRSYLD
jgi:hypothetical protein